MYILNNLKQNLLIASLTILFSGCGGGTTTTSTEETISTSTPTTIATSTSSTAKAVQSGQVKDSSTGNGLENVTVSIGELSTTTDTNGFYTLSNLTPKEKAVINFKKEGYLLGSHMIEISETTQDGDKASNYLTASLYAYTNSWDGGKPWNYETESGATGGAVGIPGGTLHTDTQGNAYTGTVEARWLFKELTTADVRDSVPGAFQGINNNGVIVPFTSYALTSLELRDTEGNDLHISDSITLQFSLSTTTKETVSLWYYDMKGGVWIQEGIAERQEDGEYIAELSHEGVWSLGDEVEEEPGIYRGYIIDADGQPITHVRLKALGSNWVSKDLSTDENGLFEIEVVPGSPFQLAAYDYENKFGATYPDVIPAISSGEIIED